ncbi:MAG TPA: hypothetical protein VF712_17820 [Thermoleophilaceae bacterium]
MQPAAKPAKPRPPRPAAGGGAGNGAPAGKPSRSEAKDAAARTALAPLAEGERPRAVTVAAVVAALFAIGNLVAFVAGLEINGDKPQASGVISYSVLMGIAAWGMWKSKYWAVLGMQAILGILIVLFSVFLFEASDIPSALICLAVIVPAGALFYRLVKAMARIQMPERRPS